RAPRQRPRAQAAEVAGAAAAGREPRPGLQRGTAGGAGQSLPLREPPAGGPVAAQDPPRRPRELHVLDEVHRARVLDETGEGLAQAHARDPQGPSPGVGAPMAADRSPPPPPVLAIDDALLQSLPDSARVLAHH